MITQQEYQVRRRALAQQLPANAIAIILGATETLRNGDVEYRFRQASDFYYLTGFEEPDAILLISSDAVCYFFNRRHDALQEQWTGKRLGQQAACEQLGMDEAFVIDSFPEQLPRLLANKAAVFYPIGQNKRLDKQVITAIHDLKKQVRRGIQAPETVADVTGLIGEMRLFKSPSEVQLMRHAADISVKAHQRAMTACRHSRYEYQLEAELLHEFTRHGCRHVAYDPIIGSGANGCILHYTNNNQPLNAGDLVLIDAGAEYANYAADITRTFPVNGRFSEAQKAIYQLVLQAQQAGIAAIKPGVLWPVVQDTMVRILTAGLVELGILAGDVEQLIAANAYKPFYMHSSGHWLGLDVHDSGRYKLNDQWRPLEAGMVLTVEPGLYIQADMPGVAPHWWTIGVRIEDDILVTDTGHDNLTAALAVEITDIEALMQESFVD